MARIWHGASSRTVACRGMACLTGLFLEGQRQNPLTWLFWHLGETVPQL